MAMGNLTQTGFASSRIGSPPAGNFRGSTTVRPVFIVYRQRDAAGSAPLNLGPYILSMQTSKQVSGTPGMWSVTLRVSGQVPGTLPILDLEGEISPDDWVQIALTENARGGRVWPIMLGLVDTLTVTRQSVDGAPVKVYTIAGRDVTKPLVETYITSAVTAGFNPVLNIAGLFNAITALEVAGSAEGPPDRVTVALLRFLMGAEGRDANVAYWRVPKNLILLFAGGTPPDLNSRQFTDALNVNSYVQSLPGAIAVNGTFLAKQGVGNQVWDVLTSYANTPLNEMFIDWLPSRRENARSPIAYYAPDSAARLDFAPALVLRERPFYTLPGSVPHRGERNDPWADLPTTTLSPLDCDTISLTQGTDLYNFFLMESGGTSLPFAQVVAQATQSGESAFEGIPAFDPDSIQIHGLRRMELSTNYVGTGGAGDLEVFAGWTRLIRDWYAPNPDFWNGSVTSAWMLPGVRVGERLILTDAFGVGRPPLQLYIEGVQHTLQMSNGVPSHSTTLTVSRGAQDPRKLVVQYAERFKPKGRSPVGQTPEPLLDDETRAALARAVALDAGDPTQVVGGPQGVQGTSPDGHPFDVPSAEE